ncbi:MAG: hypothetical protein NTW09_06055 [Candidatus Omnitrophica bacterium]|nr:hypothetical protein [Candidatus Omnitrophota bacterium]
MVMHSAFMLFLSLGLGYALCVLAAKQKGVLKTVGYTLGIAILVLTLLYGVTVSCGENMGGMWKKGGMCGMKGGMMKGGHGHMMKR